MAFDLGLQEDFSRDGFFPSPANAAALATIAGWTDWPLRRLLLIGPGGSGKTHLAHIWAAEAGAASAYLQVRAQNTPALGLYQSMGFKTAYGYHYRVPG